MANASADREFAVGDRDPIERLDAIDIDEVRGLGEPECHGRHEALTAGQDAAVVGGKFGEQRDRFVDRFRRVIAENRRFHGAMDACLAAPSQRWTTDDERQTSSMAMLLSVLCPPSSVL